MSNGSNTARIVVNLFHSSRTTLRALDSSTAAIQNMDIDHRGADIPMTQQLLDRPDIVTLFWQMGVAKEWRTLMKIAAGGGGEVAVYWRLPEAFGDEMDDALSCLCVPACVVLGTADRSARRQVDL